MLSYKQALDELIKAGYSRNNAKLILAGQAYGMGAARLEQILKKRSWLDRIEALRPGDACEWYGMITHGAFDENGYPICDWKLCTVLKNGGSFYWRLFDEKSGEAFDTDIEQIRLPGQTEAWPR